ncbi:uncharacterized protein E5676_scaffold123G00110 [Cucumis melo var. makuwa]|uniref:Uncharacterized protein LOC103497520 n=2 Tax=Cucumis melo TaxID=3656 RepID=A0A1S3C7Z6_CUCME|nr:precursor of CEP6 [Cucumis melo]KAA0045832.1 uncharacterized protein E6C27_scaffold243G003610 [Cucumis melo var. makuwa]TYJ99451.1 uncharacterized protein E5676_scaffold123G00110 [Cucumis melo var. makuwa]
MGNYHFQTICQCAILLLTIFIAFGTYQIQGRPLKPHTSSHIPSHSSLGDGFRESNVGSKDDFRPTTPGNSPGVGHHSVQRSGTMAAIASNNQLVHNTEGLKDDFRPTAPGHSPGIGHVLHGIASKPNA